MSRHHSRADLALALLVLPLGVLGAQQNDTVPSRTSTVVGTVYDSVGRRPLAEAMVQLVPVDGRGGAISVDADAEGRFRVTGVPRDRYLIGFLHPALDSLGIAAPTRAIEVRGDSAASIALALPSALTIRAQLCGTRDENDSTGLTLGFVRDAGSGAPLAGSTVVVLWSELVVDKKGVRQERRHRSATTSPEGWFGLCGLPTDATIAGRAELAGRSTGYIELDIPPRGMLHRDFFLPAASADRVVVDVEQRRTDAEPPRRGTAQLTGVVRGPNGEAFRGAQVFVWGSASSAQTADDGSFTLAALPSGTQTLEARVVGYLPKRVTVDLASGRTATATITLSERVTTLSAVEVLAKQSSRTRDLNGFLQRSKTGLGHYITAEQIERRDPVQFTDLLFTVPGIRLVQAGPFSRTIRMRDGCTPTIYLDGLPLINGRLPGGGGDSGDEDTTASKRDRARAIDELKPDLGEDLDFLVNPREIVGIEIYQVSTVPPQFNDSFHSSSGCGSIVIWTGVRPRKR